MIPEQAAQFEAALYIPRVCGDDPLVRYLPPLAYAIFPVYAGMIPNDTLYHYYRSYIPRVAFSPCPALSIPHVSGDDPTFGDASKLPALAGVITHSLLLTTHHTSSTITKRRTIAA